MSLSLVPRNQYSSEGARRRVDCVRKFGSILLNICFGFQFLIPSTLLTPQVFKFLFSRDEDSNFELPRGGGLVSDVPNGLEHGHKAIRYLCVGSLFWSPDSS